MEAIIGELQARHLGAAERLMRLSIDHGLAATALLAALAHELFELNLRHWEAVAVAEEPELMRRRVEHAAHIAGRLVDCAARLAELGSGVRAGFSRLLTEQLAAGNHGLMDAFQGFFAVLPAHGDERQMLALAAARAERALGEVDALLAQALPAVDSGVATKPLRMPAPPPSGAQAAAATEAQAAAGC